MKMTVMKIIIKTKHCYNYYNDKNNNDNNNNNKNKNSTPHSDDKTPGKWQPS